MGPIIGILTRSGINEKGTSVEYCMESTRRAIIKAGGVPIMLTPPQDIDYFFTKYVNFPDLTGKEQEMILYQIEKLDGLFIPGGDKITKYDYYVLEECLKRNIPILGICLGMLWHPEITISDDVNSKKIFAYFIKKAKDRKIGIDSNFV